MCKFKLFSIAAAALMMAACSSDDLTQQTQIKTGEMHFTATIAAPSGTTRTTYEQDGDNINVKWVVGDEIALVHNGKKDVVTVKTINSDGSATITGYVTGATNNADVRLVYPAARVGTVTGGDDGTEYTADETVEGKLKTQGGTLAYIQNNLDFREDFGALAVNGEEATLAYSISADSQIAIWKLTLSDGTNNLSATQVKIKGGTSDLASTTTLTAGTSVVTLAIPTNVAIDGALTIEATVGSDTYAYTKTGVTFNPGKYYQSTVTLTKAGWAANEYNEASWDKTNNKVVFTKKTAATTPTVVKANTISPTLWSSGWYTVSGDVTITGDVILGTDVHLILQDGATLTINGQLDCKTMETNLYIYGQEKGDGKLIVTNNNDNAINSYTNYCIEIHGGEVTASAAGDQNTGLYAGYLAVYGGKLAATSAKADGIVFNTFDVYGGEVEATSNATSGACYGIKSSSGLNTQILTVYGGKVTATGNGVSAGPYYGAGIRCYVQQGTTGIKFYFSADGTTWGDGTGYASATRVGMNDATRKRYAKAE